MKGIDSIIKKTFPKPLKVLKLTQPSLGDGLYDKKREPSPIKCKTCGELIRFKWFDIFFRYYGKNKPFWLLQDCKKCAHFEAIRNHIRKSMLTIPAGKQHFGHVLLNELERKARLEKNKERQYKLFKEYDTIVKIINEVSKELKRA